MLAVQPEKLQVGLVCRHHPKRILTFRDLEAGTGRVILNQRPACPQLHKKGTPKKTNTS